MSEKIARLDKSVIDMVYPVGAIYMSVNSTNPGNLFGGKWEQIKDRFLLAAGDSYAAGSTGGEASHTLSVEEMPPHSHSEFFNISGVGRVTAGGGSISGTEFYEILKSASQGRASGGATYTSYAGGGAAHNNMPPYLTVYMWKRIA